MKIQGVSLVVTLKKNLTTILVELILLLTLSTELKDAYKVEIVNCEFFLAHTNATNLSEICSITFGECDCERLYPDWLKGKNKHAWWRQGSDN